jgi:predicted RND superfamily exporter protein
MAQKLDTKETVSWEELSYSNMMQQEALLRLLVKKGIVTKEEFLEEMRAVTKEMNKKKAEP